MSKSQAPITVTYTRGDQPESRHTVWAVVADTDGVIESWGEVESTAIFPRSAFKPFQALATLVGDRALTLDEHQLALAMASHSGESRHVKGVEAWLDDLGLSKDDLRCGEHPPVYQPAAAALYRDGGEPGPRHHNCSGKHTAFLALAQRLDAGLEYDSYDHPVQARIREVGEEFFGCDLADAPHGVDGCGVPNYALPLANLAQAYAKLTTPPDHYAKACEALLNAWGARPDLVAGSERFDTAVMLATGGDVLSKQGAEGVQAALIRERGIGIAVKAMDGAQRAGEQAMAALLQHYEALDIKDDELRKHWKPATQTLRNDSGQVIGEIIVDLGE